METRVASKTREVIIGGDRPTVLIGERINPTGKKRLAEALRRATSGWCARKPWPKSPPARISST